MFLKSTKACSFCFFLVTATVNSKENKGSKFDIGSFVGGIALILGILSVLYIGCKMYYLRGIQHRTINEHDAIIQGNLGPMERRKTDTTLSISLRHLETSINHTMCIMYDILCKYVKSLRDY